MHQNFSAFLPYRVLGWELIGDIPRHHAQLPVVMVGPNYKERAIRFLPAPVVLNSIEADSRTLLNFSKDVFAKRPARSFS